MDFNDKLKNNEYRTKLEYPRNSLSRPTLKPGATPDEIRAFADLTEAYNAEKIKVEEARKVYRDDEQRLQDLFVKELFEYHGVTDHPKVWKAYHLAYEYGHSAGMAEVANYFSDLVELIK